MLYFWLVLLGLIWIATIWVGGRMAWGKGRSELLGGLIAALVPFIGLAIVWALPANEPARTLRQGAIEQHDRAEEEAALDTRDAQVRQSKQSQRSRRSHRRGRQRSAR
jgi:hypothetical protein